MNKIILPHLLDAAIPSIHIVDVGAMVEGEERYHKLIEHGLAHVTGFEPDETQHKMLSERTGPYTYLPLFLGNGQEACFNLARYPGCSSLLCPDPAVIDLFQTIGCADPGGNFHIQKQLTVKTTQMDNVGDLAAIDLLKLDIQGYELEVLKHATQSLKNTLVIESEVEFLALYKDQPLFGDLQCFLRDQGFVLHKLIDLSGRPFKPFLPQNPYVPMSQLLWGDAVFVRDFTKLELLDDDSLLKTFAILDLVYDSCDLAGLYLQELDKRNGTLWLQNYWTKLQTRSLNLHCANIKQHP